MSYSDLHLWLQCYLTIFSHELAISCSVISYLLFIVGDCLAEELKDAIQNDIKIAEAKLDSPSFRSYAEDSFFSAS